MWKLPAAALVAAAVLASPDDVLRSGACGFIPKQDLPGRGIELMLDGA